MRRLFLSIFLFLVAFLFSAAPLSANARAGGGSGSSSSTTSSSSSGSNSRGSGDFSPGCGHFCGGGCCCRRSGMVGSIYDLFALLLIPTFICLPFLIKKIKVFMSIYKIKKQLKEKNINFCEVSKKVRNVYFALQDAWTNGNLETARKFLTDKLYSSYKIKLEWMLISNKKNILKKIRLISCYPVFVNNADDNGNKKTSIIYYVKGRMIDYIISTQDEEIIDGSTCSRPFVEYWSFIKTEEYDWCLDKIYQENEMNFL